MTAYSDAVEANILAIEALDAARAELATAKKWRAGFKHPSRLGRLHLNWRVKRATDAVKAAAAAQAITQAAVLAARAQYYALAAAVELTDNIAF